MVKILVGSKNPVKIESVKEAFSHYFDNVEVIGVKVNSNVPDQPINEQTFDGAKNRALELKKKNDEESIDADFFVGIEGGIIQIYKKWFAFGGMCILNSKGKMGFGMSPHFELPENVAKELVAGTELGIIADRISKQTNVKQKQGMIGILTKGKMSRKNLYVPGLITALVPLLNAELYEKE